MLHRCVHVAYGAFQAAGLENGDCSGCHDFGGKQIVASQPIFAAELPEPGPERQARNASVGIDPHRRRKTMGLSCRVELSQVQASLRTRYAPNRVDFDAFHARYVDDDTTVAHRRARHIMSPCANRDEQVPGSGEIDRRYDVVGSGAINYHRRSLIDHSVPNPALLVVAWIVRNNQFAADRLPEQRDIRVQYTPGRGIVGKLKIIHRDFPAREKDGTSSLEIHIAMISRPPRRGKIEYFSAHSKLSRGT